MITFQENHQKENYQIEKSFLDKEKVAASLTKNNKKGALSQTSLLYEEWPQSKSCENTLLQVNF